MGVGTYGTDMARNKWGSTRKLSSGRYQARYTGPDGNTYKGPHTFKDELDALGWLANERKKIDLDAWEPPAAQVYKPASPTVRQMIGLWLDVTKSVVRNSTFNTYKEILESRVLSNDKICSIPVDKLTSEHVATWWQETVRAYPDTQSRNNRAYQKFRSVLALAVDYGYIPANPVYIRSSIRRVNTKVKELPTTSELKAILYNMPHRYKLVTAMALFHGLRIGEALAIQGRHVQLSETEGAIKVEATLTRVPNGHGGMMMELHKPKTLAGYRTVPVLKEFLPIVREHIATYNPGPNDFVTTTENGNPVFDTSYRARFNRARGKAGVTTNITPHFGRVYLITRLAEAGATPKEIGRILGQEDISTIVGVYMRARESRSGELMQRLNFDTE